MLENNSLLCWFQFTISQFKSVMSLWWRMRFPFSCCHLKFVFILLEKNTNKTRQTTNLQTEKREINMKNFLLLISLWFYLRKLHFSFQIIELYSFKQKSLSLAYTRTHAHKMSLPKRCKFAVLPCPQVEARWGSEWFQSVWQWRLKYNHSEKGEALGLLS